MDQYTAQLKSGSSRLANSVIGIQEILPNVALLAGFNYLSYMAADAIRTAILGAGAVGADYQLMNVKERAFLSVEDAAKFAITYNFLS